MIDGSVVSRVEDLAGLNDVLFESYNFRLEHCVVNIGTSLDPLTSLENDRINLSFLNGLKGSPALADSFIPDDIYVRESMREIFALFVKDAVDLSVVPTLLVGSSGIGKSVLFFLAALYHS
jgi:hypothetical protein